MFMIFKYGPEKGKKERKTSYDVVAELLCQTTYCTLVIEREVVDRKSVV